jgi:acetolactate synthase-1/2/3 large subunit
MQLTTPDRQSLLAEPLLENETRVADAIVAAMADAGIEFVVGIPGGLTGPIWRALHRHPTIRPVLVREESLGSYMAEAYGRLSGHPLVVMGQGEWIVGNAGQGYLESLLGSAPVVILSDMTDGGPLSHHAVYQGGSGDFGAWDAKKALEGVTKQVMVSRHPGQAVQHVQLAVKHATTGDPGPVAVVFASTALAGTIGPESVPRLYRASGYLSVPRPFPDPDDVAFVAEMLRSATRPVIIAGNGVRVGGACTALAEVADRFDVPVATTASGKGVIDETSPRAVGVIGAYGWPEANDLVGGADVVLAIGTKLGTNDTIDEHAALIDPGRQLLIQVDVDPLMLAWTTPIARAVLADANRFLEALLAAHGAADGHAATNGASWSPMAREEPPVDVADWDAVPFAPQRVIRLLNGALPSHTLVTCDAGENRLFMMRWFQNRRAGGYLQPAAGGGMGHAVPAALGAKLFDPDAPVVAVCGDGGFAMSQHGLMTAVEERLPIGVVVFNNRALGWVLHGMGEEVVAAEFADFDLAEIARSLGCEGLNPRSIEELEAAFSRLSILERPLVIDVPVNLDTSFRDILDPIDQRRALSGY